MAALFTRIVIFSSLDIVFSWTLSVSRHSVANFLFDGVTLLLPSLVGVSCMAAFAEMTFHVQIPKEGLHITKQVVTIKLLQM